MSKTTKISATIRRVKNPVIRERLLMIQASYKQPLRNVAKEFGCTHGKVDFWKKRYESQGLKGIYTKSKSGRPPKVPKEQLIKIKRSVRKHNVKQGWRTQHVRELISEQANVKYSFRHTIRLIQSWGLSKIKPRPRYAFSKQEDRDAFIKKTRATWHVNH